MSLGRAKYGPFLMGWLFESGGQSIRASASVSSLPMNIQEKTLMLGKTEGGRTRGKQRMRWMDGIIDLVDMSLSKLWEILKGRKAWHVSVHGVVKIQT